MRKARLILSVAVVALLALGCVSFTTQVFRAEQTSVAVAYTGYIAWTNYLHEFPGSVTPQASNDVKRARLRFAATASTLDALRSAYETNSAIKPQVEAALTALAQESSNVVWLISYWKGAK